MLAYVQAKAVDAGWERTATQKALLWAEMMVDMLEDELHRPVRAPQKPFGGPRPSVPGEDGRFPLHRGPADPGRAAASRGRAGGQVQRRPGRRPEGGAVRERGGQPVAGGHGAAAAASAADVRGPRTAAYLRHPNKLLVVAAPILHGMDMAMQVLEKGPDAELAAALQSRRDALDTEVQAALADADANGRGAGLYNSLFTAARDG